MGLDLGQSQDYTALAVLERAELKGPWDPVQFAWRKTETVRLRYLERIPLGTPYPEIVERVRHVTRSGELFGKCCLAVDASGVGRPVVDLLERADLHCRIFPAVITGGDVESNSGGYYRVPKRNVIVALQVLLQRRGLQIAAGLKYGAALVEEMASMRVKVTPSGNEQFAAWREGEHDDLVFAVALGYWALKKVYPVPISGDDRYWRRGEPGLR